MKKTLLIAALACSTLMCLSISVGALKPTPVPGILCNFDYVVPSEWIERDSCFSISVPSSEFDSDFSLKHGEITNDVHYVPIPDPEINNSGIQTVVPIFPESNDSAHNIISVIPIG